MPRVDRARRALDSGRRRRRYRVFLRFSTDGGVWLAGMTTTSQIGSEAAPAFARRHLRSDVDVTRRREKVSPTRARPRRIDDEGSFGSLAARALPAVPAVLTFVPSPSPPPPSPRARARRPVDAREGASPAEQLERPARVPPGQGGRHEEDAREGGPAETETRRRTGEETKARPEPANGAGGGKPASGKKGASGERHAAEEAARQLSKSDLDRDVKAVYKSLLESYKPARPGLSNRCQVQGSDLIHCARVLLDTKQFVKTYVPVEALPDLRSGRGRNPSRAQPRG